METNEHLDMSHDQQLGLIVTILGVSAWAILAFFLLAIILSIPPVEASYYARQNLPGVKFAGDALLIIMACCALALWSSAILHALLRPLPRRAGRAGPIVALVCTNIFGGLVYYFFFVRPRRSSSVR